MIRRGKQETRACGAPGGRCSPPLGAIERAGGGQTIPRNRSGKQWAGPLWPGTRAASIGRQALIPARDGVRARSRAIGARAGALADRARLAFGERGVLVSLFSADSISLVGTPIRSEI
jgi:hypothetical protein